jgi:hypothetical protein
VPYAIGAIAVATRFTRATNSTGAPTEVVVGCPDADAPILWQVAVGQECITDL